MQKKVLLVRSAFLGDFCVVFPQLKKFLSINNLTIDDIHFLIQNPEGRNPLNILFGKDSKIAQAVTPVKTGNTINYLFQLFKARLQLGPFNEIVYLNWTTESSVAKFVKTFFFRLLWPGAKKTNFEIKKCYSTSHYKSPFLFELSQPDYYVLDWYVAMLPFAKQKEVDAEYFFVAKKSTTNIGIYCSSKMEAKKWPLSNYLTVINRLAGINDLSFFLIGAAEDYDYNEILLAQLKNQGVANRVYNVAGELDVSQTVFFLSKIDLLITNDGFPMHLAALANTPTLALFTYREKVGSWDPFITDKIVTIRTNVDCKECNRAYCSNPICITLTPSDIVYHKAIEILNTKQKKREFEVVFSKEGLRRWDDDAK